MKRELGSDAEEGGRAAAAAAAAECGAARYSDALERIPRVPGVLAEFTTKYLFLKKNALGGGGDGSFLYGAQLPSFPL